MTFREASELPWVLPIALGVLTLVVAAVMLAGEYDVTDGALGGALDDSWIHYTIACNFAEGDGWSFNPGIPTGGSTAPLYTFLLAVGYFVSGSMIVWSKIIGVIGLFICGWMAARLAGRVMPDEPAGKWLAGAWVIMSPSLAWAALSGMELTMYLALATAGLWLVFSDRPTWGAALLALSVWCRPDGGWLLGFGFLAIPPRKWLKPALVAGAVLVPYFGINLLVGGELFPGTVSTKGGLHFSQARTERWVAEFFNLQGMPFRGYEINHPVLWIPLWLAGAVATWRRTWALTAFVVTFPLVFSLFYPNASSHGRYLFPIIPVAMVLGVAGIAEIAKRTPQRAAPWVYTALALILLGWTGAYLDRKAETLGWNVRNINEMHVALGKWVNQETAPDDTIAVNDVGAIGFYADRFVVDLVGLVTPHMSFWDNIETYHPEYLLIFPDWFKGAIFENFEEGTLTERFARTYQPIGRMTIQNNTVVSRNTMWIFKRVEAGSPTPRDP